MNTVHRPDDFDSGDTSAPSSPQGEAPQAQSGNVAPAKAGRGRPAENTDRSVLGTTARHMALQLRADSYSPRMITGMMRVFEFCGFALTGFVVFFAYLSDTLHGSPRYTLAVLCGSLLAVVAIQIADGYQVSALRSAGGTLPRAILAWIVACAILAVTVFFLKAGTAFSRVWFGSWLLAGIVFLVIGRTLVAAAIRKWARNGRMERRAVVVGGGNRARDLIRTLEHQPNNDIRICGIFDDRDEKRSPQIVAGYPKLGNVRALVDFVRLARIDMLIIALPLNAERRVLQFLKTLWVLPIDIRLAAHANSLRFRARSYSYIGTVPMLDIADRPITDWDSVAKRAFDIVFSLAALVVLWPIMLAAAIAVKVTSPGPVLFKQIRHGFNNEEIEVYKFRSMFTDQSDPDATKLVRKGDSRVTPVGRFIRKTSIDELPQLFNVLKGNLSLVGPRPHALRAQAGDRLYVEVVEGYFARHRVKPGVTGWAQINGWRGETDTEEKIRQRTTFDLFYIENWSLFLDLKILVLTPFRLFNTENAY